MILLGKYQNAADGRLVLDLLEVVVDVLLSNVEGFAENRVKRLVLHQSYVYFIDNMAETLFIIVRA